MLLYLALNVTLFFKICIGSTESTDFSQHLVPYRKHSRDIYSMPVLIPFKFIVLFTIQIIAKQLYRKLYFLQKFLF